MITHGQMAQAFRRLNGAWVLIAGICLVMICVEVVSDILPRVYAGSLRTNQAKGLAGLIAFSAVCVPFGFRDLFFRKKLYPKLSERSKWMIFMAWMPWLALAAVLSCGVVMLGKAELLHMVDNIITLITPQGWADESAGFVAAIPALVVTASMASPMLYLIFTDVLLDFLYG